MPPPTYDDVNLILRLYELRRDDMMRSAREWFSRSFHAKTIEEFNQICPPGSKENAWFRMVVSYWDMTASFVTSGVLHAELFYQSGYELLMCYEKVRHILPLWREGMKNHKIASNLETVAKGMIEHMNRDAPDAYETWSAMVAAR